jgi:hypothetical protein
MAGSYVPSRNTTLETKTTLYPPPATRRGSTAPRNSLGQSTLAIFALTLAAFAQTARAQLPVTQLSAISPPGGKQGTTVDATLTAGTDLDGVDRLYFSHPGITATHKFAELKPLQTAPDPLPNQFTVAIAADVPLGVYDVRAIGTFGISNPRSFVVGDLPEVAGQPGNATRDKAMAIEPNTIVNGAAGATASDWYKFSAKAGQRIVIDCWAQRIDSKMDATLVLTDSAGRQLARSRDTNRRDPLIDLAVPADGEYLLKVYDFVYGGGPEFFYRLTVGTGPHIDFILPPCGVPGTKAAYTLYGRNLPGGVPAEGVAVDGRMLEKLAVDIELPADKATERLETGEMAEPEESSLDGFEFRLRTPQGASNPYFIGYAVAPVLLEQETNDEPAKANVVTLPCEFVGQFGPRGDQDWLQFDAKAGEVYWIEVISQRLGLGQAVDPAVLLQRVTKNDKGEEQVADIVDLDDDATNIGGLAYDTRSSDAAFRFAVPGDGTYRALVRDLNFGSRGDPRHIYRLSIHREQPDFRLAAVPTYPANNKQEARPWNPLLRRGGTERIDVMAFRRDGFAGDIVVSVEGLPESVTAAPILIGGGQSSSTLVLSAGDQAPASIGAIQIVGRAKIGQADVVRAARPGAVVTASSPAGQPPVSARARLARSFTLAVTAQDTAPLLVEFGESKTWEMSRAGKLEIPVKVTRRGEIKGNLTLTALGLPANVQPQPLALDGNTNEGKFAVQINPNAPLGSYSIYLQVQSTVAYKRDPAAAEAASKAKVETDKLAADTAEAAKAADAAKQVADKAATETDAAAKAAAAAKATADAAAKTAADEAKAAADKAAASKTAADGDANKQDLAKAKEAADKAAADAGAKAKTAAEAQVAAEKAAVDAAAKAKAAAEAKVAADKAAADAAAKVKAAADLKAVADKRATDTAAAAAPKDVALFWPSTTTTLKITAAPITLAVTPPAAALKQGQQLEFPVALTRLYGYAEAIELEVALPAGVSGLKIDKVTVPAGQNEGKLVIVAAANATPGNHNLAVKATAMFNGQKQTADQVVPIVIEKVEQTK